MWESRTPPDFVFLPSTKVEGFFFAFCCCAHLDKRGSKIFFRLTTNAREFPTIRSGVCSFLVSALCSVPRPFMKVFLEICAIFPANLSRNDARDLRGCFNPKGGQALTFPTTTL